MLLSFAKKHLYCWKKILRRNLEFIIFELWFLQKFYYILLQGNYSFCVITGLMCVRFSECLNEVNGSFINKFISVISKSICFFVKSFFCTLNVFNEIQILQLPVKFQTAIVSYSKFIWITNSSDQSKV